MSKGRLMGYYILGVAAFFIIVLLNYFHQQIETVIPFYGLFILLVSITTFSIFGYFLFERELEIENIKYQFLTVVTHRFRTPITAIKWLVGNLRKEVMREEKLGMLDQIDLSVARLSEAVDVLAGLARFSNKLDYAFELTWLREMIDAALMKCKQQFKEKNITFSISSDQDVPLVMIDKRKIQFVVDTLLENAILYSAKDGHIDISLKKDGNYVILSLKDNGIGIDRHSLPHIFEQFFRTDDARSVDTEGMGLSLFMINEIIKKHNGKIWAESEGVNKGSTFHVKLKVS